MPQPPARDGYVLIVEDDAAIRETLAEVLGDQGYTVKCAADGSQALEICRLPPRPNLILLDLRMPVMDGEEFARVKASDPVLSRIPICVMTASGSWTRLPESVDLVLRKPIDLPDLLAVVRRFC